jgi:hypothetical protein
VILCKIFLPFPVRTRIVLPSLGNSNFQFGFSFSASYGLSAMGKMERLILCILPSAQFEKAEKNRIESFRVAGANRQQRSSIAMTEECDVKLGLATVDNATHVAVLFVDIFVTRFGIAQVKLAAAGSRVLQQPRCRPVFKLISWQQ